MSAPANATFTGTAGELRRTFLDGLASAGEGERNVAAHALGVDRFGEYLAPRDLRDAKDSDLEGFLSYLTELGVSASSLRTYRTVVTRWLSFLAENRPAVPAEAVLAEEAAELESEEPPVAIAQALPEPEAGGAEADPLSQTLILSDFTSPPAAARAFEPEPTSPMMRSVPEPADETCDDGGPGEDELLTDEPSMIGFEPVAPPSPQLFVDGDEPPATEAAMRAIEEPAEAECELEPPAARAAREPAEEAAVGVAEEAEAQPEEEPDERLDAASDFSIEVAAPDESSAPPLETFSAPEPAAEDEGEPDDEPVSAFGDLPPALEGDLEFEAPVLDDAERAAEERDKAKLAAPPLPSLQAAPSAGIPGETDFQGPSSSIPLAGLASAGAGSLADTGSRGDETQRGAMGGSGRSPALDPTNGAMATQPGTGKWGLRRPQGERLELSLDAILTLAVSGELKAADLVRKPSGEWVNASELRPLRRALGLDGGPDTVVRRARTELLLGRSAAGAVVAGLFAGLMWWVTALVVGAELVPLAILGGLLGGFGARMAGRAAELRVGLLGAAAAPLSVLVGRYLVYETLSSGIALEGFQEIGGLGSFLGSGMGTTQLVCLGLGALAGLLVGSIGNR